MTHHKFHLVSSARLVRSAGHPSCSRHSPRQSFGVAMHGSATDEPLDVAERLRALSCDPIGGMARIAMYTGAPLGLRADVCTVGAGYRAEAHQPSAAGHDRAAGTNRRRKNNACPAPRFPCGILKIHKLRRRLSGATLRYGHLRGSARWPGRFYRSGHAT